MKRTELAIVGAGPAGLAAALIAAKAGVQATLIDEQQRPGGQIYRQPPDTFQVDRWLEGKGYAPGRALLREAAGAQDQLQFLHGTTVWGIFDTDGAAALERRPPRILALSGPQGSETLMAERVLFAPGAYDLPLAFPGWTLPGVMSAGGVQAFGKSQRLLPGHRFLLAGAHPLLLIVAAQLLADGAEIAALVLAQRPALFEGLRHLGALPGHWGKLAEALACFQALRQAKVPILFGHAIRSAHGADGVESAVVGPVDEAWRPLSGDERRLEVDTVVLGYGFVPSTDLSRQVGCAHTWDLAQGGWICSVDETMETTAPGIWAAGEITGVAGAEVAMAEGKLAGIAVAESLGRLAEGEGARLRQGADQELAPARRFAQAVTKVFAPQPGFADWITPETTVCRCEELTAQDLTDSLQANPFLGEINEVKLLTRCGMGPCQGRMCQISATYLVCGATGRAPEDVAPMRVRVPVKPVPIAQLIGP